MKKEWSLKLILAILVIVLVCLVSLGGVYVKNKNISKNALAEYILGMDLDTRTVLKLDVQKDEENSSEENNEEISNEEQADENVEQSENTEENNSNVAENNTDTQKEQKENVNTLENYKKAKKIIEQRLKIAEVGQYLIRLDEQSGNIVVEVPDSVSSYILEGLGATGKVEIKVSETGEVLGENKAIKNFKVGVDDTYLSSGIGKRITLDVEFNKDIINKFKDMKNNYVAPVDESGATTQNNIEILIDGTSIYSAEELEFLENASTGSLKLSYGDYSTDEKQIDALIQYTNSRKMLVETENLAVKYSTELEQTVHSNISEFGIKCVFAVVLGIMLLYLLIKYKGQGLLAMLNVIGFQALLLLVIRYTKIQISIVSIVAIIGMMILQFIYLINILSNGKISSKKFSEKTLEFTKLLIPAFIITVALSVMPATKLMGNALEISTFGMVGFWGLILFELFNNILTRAILTNAKNK